MIKCNNIHLSFGDTEIFKGFDLQVSEGEFLCIGGESGRGKSTLLKMLQGYVIPDSGEISIGEEILDTKSLGQIRKQITWIPQNVNLPVNNGLELLSIMNIIDGQDKISEYLTLLGLDESYLKKEFTKISGGQKQRVVIATCLSLNRPILLMDEPTSSLDENSITKLLEAMKGLKGKTIITASHNKTWIQNCDRVVEL